MIRVELSPAEFEECRRIGLERAETGRRIRKEDTDWGANYYKNEHYAWGAAGEMAVKKVLKLGITDDALGITDRPDGGLDGRVKGKSYDVKTSMCPNGHLILYDKNVDDPVDIWIYAERAKDAERTILLKKCISHKRFLPLKERKDMKYGARWVLHSSKMEPIEKFVRWANDGTRR